MPMTISAFYADDHDQIDRLFDQYRGLKGEASGGLLVTYREFKTRLERHIGWEEEILFPLFERLTGMSDRGPTAVMRSEHRRIKHFLESIDTTLHNGDTSVDVNESALLEVLAAHNWKEEHILYPLIDRQVSPEERDVVFARMRAEIAGSASADTPPDAAAGEPVAPDAVARRHDMTTHRELTPSSALPMVYFGWAHVGLAAACAILAVRPDLPGGYFLHPRMVAAVHLVTLAWITGSILGACYLVGPLALGVPMPVGRADWLACASFVAGTTAMVGAFWAARYDRVAEAAPFVLIPVVWVGARTAWGSTRLAEIRPVIVHVRLAFVNVLVAGLLGILLGLDRTTGVLRLVPVAAAVAHAHLMAIGWPVMMVVGIAYRLVPMFLPSKMPAPLGLATSAVLMEVGLVVLTVSLLIGSAWLTIGVGLIVAGIVMFARRMRRAVRKRLPRPPALPRRDWSTWQTHAALGWLLVSVALGVILVLTPASPFEISLAWIYGVAGLLGFVSQIIVGIQGRLVPLYAYYRAMALGGRPPERAANALPSPTFARPIFVAWTVGVPWLAGGLAVGHRASISGGATVLLGGVIIGAFYQRHLYRQARRPL